MHLSALEPTFIISSRAAICEGASPKVLRNVRVKWAASEKPPRKAASLKRAPSAPPGLAVGERPLLLLRGARSPYLLVDRPGEILRVPQDADEEVWAREIGALARAGRASGSPDTLATADALFAAEPLPWNAELF